MSRSVKARGSTWCGPRRLRRSFRSARRRRARPPHRLVVPPAGRLSRDAREGRRRRSERRGADVVGLEEGEHSTRAIADALGWYASERTAGRLALPDHRPARRRRHLRLRRGRAGPDRRDRRTSTCRRIRTGRTRSATARRSPTCSPSSGRPGCPALADQLRVLPGLAAAGMPVVPDRRLQLARRTSTGRPPVAAVRPDVPFPVDWPVSRALARAGFRDSYRDVHPDPVAVPGLHLDAGRPGERSARGPRPHRLGAGCRAGHGRSRATSSARRAVRTSATRSRRGRPTTAASSRRSRSRRRCPRRIAAVEARRVVRRRHARRPVPRRRRHRPAPGDRAGRRGAVGSAVASRRSGRRRPRDGRATFATAALAPGAYDAILVGAAGAVRLAQPVLALRTGSADDRRDLEERHTSSASRST